MRRVLTRSLAGLPQEHLIAVISFDLWWHARTPRRTARHQRSGRTLSKAESARLCEILELFFTSILLRIILDNCHFTKASKSTKMIRALLRKAIKQAHAQCASCSPPPPLKSNDIISSNQLITNRP